MSKRHRTAVTLMACIAALVVGAGSAIPDTFDDVPPDHWAQSVIDRITTASIMESCGGPFFCPDGIVTREDMAVWLERARHGSGYDPGPGTGDFQDVPSWYCLSGWIEAFKDDGFTAGCNSSPPLYCPYNPVNREQMAVFLLVLKYGTTVPLEPCHATFDDVPCSNPLAPWVEKLARDGITAGCSLDPPLFCPKDEVTRAQMAAFITATCECDDAQCAGSW